MGLLTVILSLIGVWAHDGHLKVPTDVRPHAAQRNSVWDGTTLRIFGARNEVVSATLVLEASADISGVQVQFDRLIGPVGHSIQNRVSALDPFDWRDRPIEIFRLDALPIRGLSRLSYDIYDERHIPKRFRRPHDRNGKGRGDWTDRPDHDRSLPEIAVPLMPGATMDLKKNTAQSVLFDVYIPKDRPPGRYSGMIRVTGAQAVPIELTVRNFSLPDTTTAATMVVLGYADINRRYLGESHPSAMHADAVNRLRDRHFQLAHRHRISLIDSNQGPEVWTKDAPRPAWIPRLTGELFTKARGYDGPGVGVGNGVFSIGTYGSWTWKTEGQAGMHRHTDAWERWFQDRAPKTERFLYLIDESKDYAQIATWAFWAKAGQGPGRALPLFITASLPNAASPVGPVDIIASRISVAPTQKWEAAVSAWRGSGRRFYAYNGARPATGSFAIEDDGVALRQLPWAQYKKGIARWFFWESTYYHNYQGGQGETDVWRVAQTFGGVPKPDPSVGEASWNYSNGDGVLFYPGTDRVYPHSAPGIDGPIASLRLKLWRRGIQDVEYLVQAARIDPAATAGIVQQMVPKVLWEYGVNDPKDPTWVRTDISWPTDPDTWEAARLELANIIDPQ